MKFKEGDTVRLIEADSPCKHGFNKGDICKILSTNEGGNYPIKIKTDYSIGYASEDEIELIKEDIKMDFKVGDLIKGMQYNGYGVTNENMTKAEVIGVNKSDKTINIKILEHIHGGNVNDTYWVNNDNKKFELISTMDNKYDLETGDIVTLRNGDQLVYNKENEEFRDVSRDFNNSLSDLYDLNNDMTYNGNRNYDIVKVERAVKYNTIYTRKDVKKMTVSDICKELGYDVEIIKED